MPPWIAAQMRLPVDCDDTAAREEIPTDRTFRHLPLLQVPIFASRKAWISAALMAAPS